MPRAYHAACKTNDDRLFIFGGCYTSNLRYNDCFYMKPRKLFFYFSEFAMVSTPEPKILWNS